MRVEIRYLGGANELFGLAQGNRREVINLPDGSKFEDALKEIQRRFQKANKDSRGYDVFNDVVVLSNGRVVASIRGMRIDHPEIIIAPLIAGG